LFNNISLSFSREKSNKLNSSLALESSFRGHFFQEDNSYHKERPSARHYFSLGYPKKKPLIFASFRAKTPIFKTLKTPEIKSPLKNLNF
jgi:hypothetical protein